MILKPVEVVPASRAALKEKVRPTNPPRIWKRRWGQERHVHRQRTWRHWRGAEHRRSGLNEQKLKRLVEPKTPVRAGASFRVGHCNAATAPVE